MHPRCELESEIVLTQTEFTVDFESLSSATGAAVVQASCADYGELVVSADDLNETRRTLTLAVSDEVDLETVEPGDPIVFRFDPDAGDDAVFDLGGFGADSGAEGADDEESFQGDYPRGSTLAGACGVSHALSSVSAAGLT